MTKCKCGNKLKYDISPFMTAVKYACNKCGNIHYVDYNPIDWIKVNKSSENGYIKPTVSR